MIDKLLDNKILVIIIISAIAFVLTVLTLISHRKRIKKGKWKIPYISTIGAIWLTVALISSYTLFPDFFSTSIKSKLFDITPFRLGLAVYIIFLTIYFARLIKWFFLIRSQKQYKFQAYSSIVVLWIIALSWIIKIFLRNPDKLFDFRILRLSKASITIIDLITFLTIISATSIILIFIRTFFDKKIQENKLDSGSGIAIYKILSYVIWTTALLVGLDMTGINITFLIAGSTALLVGVGIGIQQVFHDFVSGIIILSERKIEVGDIIEVGGIVGKVTDVSFRVTTVLTRDNIEILIPNSKLTSENVINWTHSQRIARYNIPVGVAYGSDPQQVIEILEKVALSHPRILKEPLPEAVLTDFGDSSINFQLYFYTEVMLNIYRIKSELMIKIYKEFEKHNISIPFPQRDVHLFIQEKNNENNNKTEEK